MNKLYFYHSIIWLLEEARINCIHPIMAIFLRLVQLIAKFDAVMQEHVKLAMKGNISDCWKGNISLLFENNSK